MNKPSFWVGLGLSALLTGAPAQANFALGITAQPSPLVGTSQASEQLVADNTAIALPPTVVIGVATKQQRPILDVAAAVDVLTADDMQRTLSESLADALNYESGVFVEGGGNRFGSAGINVRGIGKNRVLIEVDGVPVNQRFELGSYANATAFLPEVDLIKRVEILKGPASTLYGSDAIGGVVAIHTWNPEDLAASDEPYYRLRSAYDGRTHGRALTGMAAWQGAAVDGLLAFSQRDGKARVVHDSVKLNRDFRDWDQQSLFGKFTHGNATGGIWRLEFLASQKDNQSQINSFIGQGRFRRTSELRGDDHNRHTQFSLEHEFSLNGLFDDGLARLFHANTRFTQNTHEKRRSRRGTPLAQYRQFNYRQKRSGLELNGNRNWSSQRFGHSLVAGFELERTDVEEFRNATQTNLTTGEVTNSILGETFPRRDFPNSIITEAGLFLLDEIRLLDSPWTFIPALRFDYYHLKPERDALFDANGLDTEVVTMTESDLSPKLGVLYALSDNTRLFAQYARGFRAPPFDDVNIGLNIPLFHLRAIPNPDLKSETSNGYELGLRHYDDRQRLEFSLYYTRFNDFIETKARLGVDPETGTLLFQSININEARIFGAELDYHRQLGEQWAVDAKLGWARGDNLSKDQPLNSVSPAKGVFSGHWQSLRKNWFADAYWTVSAAQDRVDESRDTLFKPAGYGVVDLFAGYQWQGHIGQEGEVRLGVYNVFDKKYWDWQQVRNFDANDAIVNALAQPGRTFSASLSVRF
jgi:hemoglobin/transferrin/lactoferrin receptor protein